MSENARKYLLYAAGEVLLVVIGILIALQIDTWNENRKLQQRQAEMLTDLRSDLEETRKELEFGMRFNTLTLENYRNLMKSIEDEAPYSAKIDSASRYLPMFHVPRFTRTTYESIKSQGLDLITNDELKRQIAGLYENSFLYLIEDQAKVEWSLFNTTTLEVVNRYLKFMDNGDLMVYPVDFEAMKVDPSFVNFLAQLIVLRASGVRFYEGIIQEISTVISAIDTELETLRK